MARSPRSAAKKTPAKQLDREIAASLAKQSAGSMEQVTRDRVHEALTGERITRTDPIQITLLDAIGPEPWKLVFTKGKNYGGANAERVLVTLGGLQDPLAGLAYAVEYGRPYVHHVWVDSDARRTWTLAGAVRRVPI